MIVPSIHRAGAVTLADRARLSGPGQRTAALRIVLVLALAGTAGLLYLQSRSAGAGRAAVFPSGVDTGVVALDMSASISGPTFARIASTLRSIGDANQSIGLVMFSDTAYELLPPNSPPAALTQFVPYFVPVRYYGGSPIFAPSPWDIFSGGTRIAAGLRMAADALLRAHVRHGAILLVSDLDDASGDEPLLEQEAGRLQQQHIPLRIVPLFASPHNVAHFSTLFGGDGIFVDPKAFTHTAHRRVAAIAAPAPWALIAFGVLLVVLLAANERWNARLETA
jgi:hypothetical protein